MLTDEMRLHAGLGSFSMHKVQQSAAGSRERHVVLVILCSTRIKSETSDGRWVQFRRVSAAVWSKL